METSKLSFAAAAPWKTHVSRVEPEELEQLKETSESRNTKSVPLGRAEAGPMDVLKVPGSPGGKRTDILTPGRASMCGLIIKQQSLTRRVIKYKITLLKMTKMDKELNDCL